MAFDWAVDFRAFSIYEFITIWTSNSDAFSVFKFKVSLAADSGALSVRAFDETSVTLFDAS